MFAWKFWRDLLERGGKTAAQMVLGVYGVDLVGGGVVVGAWDWRAIINLVATGFVISALTSIASAPFGENGNASLVGP